MLMQWMTPPGTFRNGLHICRMYRAAGIPFSNCQLVYILVRSSLIGLGLCPEDRPLARVLEDVAHITRRGVFCAGV